MKVGTERLEKARDGLNYRIGNKSSALWGVNTPLEESSFHILKECRPGCTGTMEMVGQKPFTKDIR